MILKAICNTTRIEKLESDILAKEKKMRYLLGSVSSIVK